MVFVYIFIGLIVALLLMAAVMPAQFNIEKTTVINKPVPHVMNHVKDLALYCKWNPWQQSDPTVKNTIAGTPGTPGHRYSWEGKKVGTGHLTLKGFDDKHVHLELQFLKPWKSQAKDNWMFEPWGDNQTKVTWQNNGQLPWPIMRLMGPLLKKSLNHQFDKGLENLKYMCEGTAAS